MADNIDHCDHFLSGPDFELTFSTVDQAVPPIYSRRVLIFSHDDDDFDQDKAVDCMRRGLKKTLDELPLLAGQMRVSPIDGWSITPGYLRLRVKNLDIDFKDLEAADFSEDLIPADLISDLPSFSDPHAAHHSCRIQANFIRGGLLLVISVHHLCMDGIGITRFIERFARHARTKGNTSKLILPPWLDGPLIWKERDLASETSKEHPGDIDLLKAYTIVKLPYPFTPAHPGIRTQTFRFPTRHLKSLKAASSPDPIKYPGQWITTHDAILALFLRTYAQTRVDAHIIEPQEMARFCFPIEFRQIKGLSPQYVGNAVMMTKVNIPVATLIGDRGLAEAAMALRSATREIDLEQVDNFIAVAKAVQSDPTIALRINLKFEDVNTAFGCTSYKNFAHGALDWDPKVFGKYERLRLPSGVAGEGITIVMPVLQDGSWEITVMVEEFLMEAFKEQEEWMRFTSA